MNSMQINLLNYVVRYHVQIIVLLLPFVFILFFTQCVPFFFDDHQFHQSYVQQTYSEQLSQLFSFNWGRLSDGPRPVFGIFFKTLFPFFGFDYCGYRVAKAVIFSFVVFILFLLAKLLFNDKIIAAMFALFVMTLFPFYIQTFGYTGPHIIAELFKILAIFFFLKDIKLFKTSYRNQYLVFFSSLFAIRAYFPAFSIAAILSLFMIFYDRTKVVRYLPLFLAITLIQFPITFNFDGLSPNSNSIYTPKTANLKNVFFNDFAINVLNFVPNYSNLYYKSFTAILSFFGFWLIIFLLCFLIFVYLTNKSRELNFDSKLVFVLSLVWMFSELPAYTFLPENAIRYIFPFMIPFSILITLLIVKFIESCSLKNKKFAIFFVILMISASSLTNIYYTYAFRAGWGSSFTVFDEGMDFFSESYAGKKVGVLYFAGSVAEEYYDINKSSPTYAFGNGISYIKSANLSDFSEGGIIEASKKFSEFYVIKRVTSISKTAYPKVQLEKYKTLKEIKVLNGSSDTLFDEFNLLITRAINISYAPNKIHIYKYAIQDKNDKSIGLIRIRQK